jgi:hypothetical protein
MKIGIPFIFLLVFVLFSCVPPVTTVHLNRIDVFLVAGATVSGTLTLELRDSAGTTPALWSNTVNTNTLIPGVDGGWNSFTVPDIELTRGQTYRIYVMRSIPHTLPTDTITWRSSDTIGVDRYTAGVSSHGSAVLDFAFRTYDNSVVDQKMETMEYGLGVSNTEYRWQGFVPGS